MAKDRPKTAAFKKSQKKRLHRQAEYACQVCGSGQVGASCRNDGGALKPHHILPVCKGGETAEWNCAVICVKCHCALHARAVNSASRGEAKAAMEALGLEKAEQLAVVLNAANFHSRPELPCSMSALYADLCR